MTRIVDHDGAEISESDLGTLVSVRTGPRTNIERRLRASGDVEAANYIASLEGTLKSANEKTEAARVALVLHTKDLLRTLKRWGIVKPS